MLHETTVRSNGTHLNGHTAIYPPCASDYEAAPSTDVQAKPAWQSAFPKFTHNLTWTDADGCSHSLTLRSDDLSGLFADIKLMKGMIRASKAKHVAKSSTPTDTQLEHVMCKIHNLEMERRVSKRTGGHYFCHALPGTRDLCFGRAPKG